MQPSSNQRALFFLDWFLAPELRRAPLQDLRRARVLAGGSLLMQAMLVAIAADLFRRGLSSAWSTLFAVFVWAALLPMLRLGHDRLAGIWIASYAQLSMLFVVLHQDASYVLFDPWQGVLIMTGLYFVGTGFGVMAAGISIAEMVVIPILGQHGWLIETPFLGGHGPNAIDSGAAMIAILALGWLYSSAREGANQVLQETLQTLSESREQYQLIVEGTDAVPFGYDLNERVFNYIGPQARRVFGWSLDRWSAEGFIDELLPGEESSRLRHLIATAVPGQRMQLECTTRSIRGEAVVLRLIATLHAEFGARTLVGLMLDITELRRLETELRQAQKLESVGRLASGVAHEINTPVQFVADSVDFLREGSRDLLLLLKQLRIIRGSVLTGTAATDAIAKAVQAEDEADLDYLFEHMPAAFDRAHDGLNRVSEIVRSMKVFAHPDGQEMTTVDLNHALASTLTIARHEYRQVAEVETSFGELPPVSCFAGEINQAFLNIIVNAAHALDESMKATGRRGRISIETRREGEQVLIRISDTGVGIPRAIQERVFDPFFTTKPVGKGTGQGLAVTRSVIVEKHQGALWFESEVGVGTSFFIRLPIARPLHSIGPRGAGPTSSAA